MNKKVSSRMQEIKSDGGKALIPYFMAGYPDFESFEYLVLHAEKAGADLIEIGMPFSDPVADGPVIQAAGQHVLDNGITPYLIVEKLSRLKDMINIPVIVMTYANPVMAYGITEFFHDIYEAGISGIILPDGEIAAERDLFANDAIERIRIIAPNTGSKRIQEIASVSSGFLYAVSVAGTTGIKLDTSAGWGDYMARVREVTDMPVCAGFGISTPAEAKTMAEHFDGVICGSALLRKINKDGVNSALALIHDMKESINN